MRIVPLQDKVVVQRLKSEEVTAGGIVLPESAQQKPTQGKVLSVGDGRLHPNGTRIRPQVGEGDRIVFASYAGNEVVIDGETLLIISDDDILAVFE